MYYKSELSEKIYLTTNELKNINTKIENNNDNYSEKLDKIILQKLKDNFGNKCMRYGLIKKDSIQIKHRSVPIYNTGHFNASVTIKVKFIAELCNPSKGDILEAFVISHNKMGVMASITTDYSSSPLIIMLPRQEQEHINDEKFKKITTSHKIKLEILGIKFERGATQMICAARFIDFVDKKTKNNKELKGGKAKAKAKAKTKTKDNKNSEEDNDDEEDEESDEEESDDEESDEEESDDEESDDEDEDDEDEDEDEEDDDEDEE